MYINFKNTRGYILDIEQEPGFYVVEAMMLNVLSGCGTSGASGDVSLGVSVGDVQARFRIPMADLKEDEESGDIQVKGSHRKYRI